MIEVIDLGEIAISTTSISEAINMAHDSIFGPDQEMNTSHLLHEEAVLTVPASLAFKALRAGLGISLKVDHYIKDQTWYLSVGGVIVHAVEP